MALNFNPNELGSNLGFNVNPSDQPWMKHLASLNIPGFSLDANPKSRELFANPNTNELNPPGAGSDKLQKWQLEYEAILKRGDGNAAVDHIIKGLKEGTITKEQAAELAKTVQEGANAGGGGRINGQKRDALKEALGLEEDLISKGKTRGQMGWDKFVGVLKSIFFIP